MYVDGTVSSALTVQTYTGGAWSVLGKEGAIIKNTGMAKERSAMAFSGNNLMTFLTSNADDAATGIKKRGANLSVWDGSAWTASPLPTRDATWYAYTPRAVAVGDDLDKFNGFVKMNDVGAEIFEILKNDVEFDEIVKLMMEKHPDATKEEAEETIRGFIDELKKSGIIDG